MKKHSWFPPLRGKFGLILADPPWRFKTWTAHNVKGPKYRLMSSNGIASLPVLDLAEPDCALVLWATQAQLDQALDAMHAWGFKFKSAGTWAKQSKTGGAWAFGTGYIFRSAAEFFLLGTRGSPKTSSRSQRNLIVAPVREHSRKPDEMYTMLEAMFPAARKCELFARSQRNGWSCWGDGVKIFRTPKK